MTKCNTVKNGDERHNSNFRNYQMFSVASDFNYVLKLLKAK